MTADWSRMMSSISPYNLLRAAASGALGVAVTNLAYSGPSNPVKFWLTSGFQNCLQHLEKSRVDAEPQSGRLTEFAVASGDPTCTSLRRELNHPVGIANQGRNGVAPAEAASRPSDCVQ